MIYSNSKKAGEKFYERIFETLDELLPRFTKEDLEEIEDFKREKGVYMSNQEHIVGSEKELEILTNKNFFNSLDKTYAIFEFFRLLTYKRRYEDELADYLREGKNENAKNYLNKQLDDCKQKILKLNAEFSRVNKTPQIDVKKYLSQTLDKLMFEASNKLDKGYLRKYKFEVLGDIGHLERYTALINHFYEALGRTNYLAGNISIDTIRENLVY